MGPAFTSEHEDRVSRSFERFADRRGSQLRYVLLHPRETVDLLRTLRRLPRLTAALSDDDQGRAIRSQLDRTWLRRHALAGATAVLGLPEVSGDYVRGSSGSKYTLRRRSRAARELGVQVEAIDSPERRRQLCAVADEYERRNPREAYRNAEADNADMLAHRFWFAAYQDGRPILLAVLPADGEWAALRYFRTLEPTDVATLSRYLMMEEVVAALVPAGVRRIAVGLGPHRLGNGIRRFQRMMGFRVVRLDVRPDSADRSSAGAPAGRRSGTGARFRTGPAIRS